MLFYQNFKMWLSSKFSKELELYKSIDDFPIYNFHKVMVTNDLRYLVKNEITEQTYKKNINKLGKKWVSLYDEYLEHFGLSKQYQKILELQTKIAKLICQRWEKEEKSLETIIHIEQTKLKELNGKKEKSSTFEEDIAVIEQYRKIGLDAKTTSVKMFYTYIKLMEKDGKKN